LDAQTNILEWFEAVSGDVNTASQQQNGNLASYESTEGKRAEEAAVCPSCNQWEARGVPLGEAALDASAPLHPGLISHFL